MATERKLFLLLSCPTFVFCSFHLSWVFFFFTARYFKKQDVFLYRRAAQVGARSWPRQVNQQRKRSTQMLLDGLQNVFVCQKHLGQKKVFFKKKRSKEKQFQHQPDFILASISDEDKTSASKKIIVTYNELTPQYYLLAVQFRVKGLLLYFSHIMCPVCSFTCWNIMVHLLLSTPVCSCTSAAPLVSLLARIDRLVFQWASSGSKIPFNA